MRSIFVALAIFSSITLGCSGGGSPEPGPSTPDDTSPVSPDGPADSDPDDEPPMLDMSDAGMTADDPIDTPPPEEEEEEDTDPDTGSLMCTAEETQYLRDNAQALSGLGLECGLGCASDSDVSGCFTDCADDEVTEVSSECISCLGDLLECAIGANCLAPCIGGLEAPACAACLCDSGCAAPYDVCAGTTTADLCD